MTKDEINSEMDCILKRLASLRIAASNLEAQYDQFTAGWREGLFDAAYAAVQKARINE